MLLLKVMYEDFLASEPMTVVAVVDAFVRVYHLLILCGNCLIHCLSSIECCRVNVSYKHV